MNASGTLRHDIAILDYLLGLTPAWVSAVGANPVRHSLEDVGFITLGYPGGIVGHIHVSWADPNKVRQVVVVGSEKRIVFNDMDSLERVRVFEKGVKSVDGPKSARYGEHTLHLRDGAIMSPPIPALEPLKNQCGAFIHAIRGRGAPITDGAQGARSSAFWKRSTSRWHSKAGRYRFWRPLPIPRPT